MTVPPKPGQYPDGSAMYDDGSMMLSPDTTANENVFVDEKSTRDEEAALNQNANAA
ncbi:MAG TPA: hypothetical protein VHB93_02050 [Candidatus Paceibacterota bacterium]|nr:hypothetical protein [Candidatus Paceibacterota bacterium]